MFRIRVFIVLISVAVAVHSQNQPKPSPAKQQQEEPDVNTIPGVAGKDYPNFHDIPKTNFACSGKIPGYYADTEARCQLWHYCNHDGLVESFLCPNGTIYSQERRVCEWYYDVDCERSNKFIDVNKDLYIIPETTKAPSRTANEKQQQQQQLPLQEKANKRKRYVQF